MLRRCRTPHSAWRVVGSFLVIAMAMLVSATPADARRGPSPYAFEDPITPEVQEAGTETTERAGIVPDPAGPTVDPVLPAVAETDVPEGAATADPQVDPQRPIRPGGLASTGARGLTSRIAFAMVLVAIGFLTKEASGRRRALAR